MPARQVEVKGTDKGCPRRSREKEKEEKQAVKMRSGRC